MTSIVVSMSAPRNRRSSTNSISAPSMTPSSTATTSAAKKFSFSGMAKAYII